MADEPEKSGQEPNLELPSLLGFGRKKKRKGDATQTTAATEELAAPDRVAPAEGNEPLAADPVEAPTAPPGVAPGTPPQPPGPTAAGAGQRSGLAPATGTAKRLPPVPPPSKRAQPAVRPAPTPPPVAGDPAPVEAAAETAVVDEPAVIAERVSPSGPPPLEVPEQEISSVEDPGLVEPALEGPVTAPRSEDARVDTATHAETTVLPAAAAPAPPAATAAPAATAGTTITEEPLGRPPGEAEQPIKPAQPRARRSPSLRLPAVNPWLAVAVTGALIGFMGVLLSALASRGCESVRGVGSCGGLGLLALLIIVAIQVFVGAALLAAWRILDAVSTSFLGVGLAAAFVLLFVLSSLESAWMFLVIPLISAATFLVSLWVTTALVDSGRSDDLGR